MTPEQAKKLKVGDKVHWYSGEPGTVEEVSYAAVRVHWADGAMTLFTFLDVEPLKELSKV